MKSTILCFGKVVAVGSRDVRLVGFSDDIVRLAVVPWLLACLLFDIRYLQECGYVHSAFSFAHESMLGSTGLRSADKALPPGALVTFLQKGLQYVGIEERLRLEGVGKEAAAPVGSDKAKENHKKNVAAAANEPSEFSLLSQSAVSAIARRDPPLQLNVPPATAAAAVKARLQAEAKIEAERKAAASIAVADSIQQTNLAAAVIGADSTPNQPQQQPNNSTINSDNNKAPNPEAAAGATSQQQTDLTGLPDHLSNAAALARQQALAAQALQLQQQQQQFAAEQLAAGHMAAAVGGAPLASLANAFGAAPHNSRTTAADILALQQGAQHLAGVADATNLADAAMALASQQQQQQAAGPSSTTSSAPQKSQSKQQAGAPASASSAPSKQLQRGGSAGSSNNSNTSGAGPKRGTKRQKVHNEEVQRITDKIAGLTAQAEIDLQQQQNQNKNSRGNPPVVTSRVPSPATSAAVDLEQAFQQQQQQQQQVDFRSNAQHANLVGHQEFRPIHQAGQEQFMNGQLVNPGAGNGKEVVADHRIGGVRGINGERIESNNTSSNLEVSVPRMESSESLASNPEDLDTGTPQGHILKLEMHESEVFMCAWNPIFTNLIATGSGDASARIWQVGGTKAAAGLTTVKLLPHGADPRDRKNKDVTTLEWCSDGTLLATGSYDGVARVWARNGALIHTLRGHTGPIFSLKWNKQGNFLLSGSYDKTTIVWDVSGSTGFVEQQFTEHKAPALDVDWKDNTTFASCSTDKTVHICRVGVSRPLKVYFGHSDEVNAVKWDPSGQLLASCSDDCTAKIWDVESDRTDPLYDLKSHEQEIYTVKWSPTGPGSRHPNKKAILATASFDGSVRLWNVADGSCYRVFNRHKDSVYSVAFSPSGDFLASGSLAGQMYVWDIELAKHIKSYKGKGDIFEVAWNKEETRVAACFSSNVVAIIDFERPPS